MVDTEGVVAIELFAYEAGRELFALDGGFGLNVSDAIPLDGRPFGVAADEDGTWVVLQDAEAAVRVDGLDLTAGEPISLDEG